MNPIMINELKTSEPNPWAFFLYVSKSYSPNGQGRREDNSSDVAALSAAPSPTLTSLASAKRGDRLRIVSLNCGESNNRLMGMGLMPDVLIEVMSCTGTGSVIVALQDQRLGLGAEMAQRIQVIDAAQPHTARMIPMQTTSDHTSDTNTGTNTDTNTGTNTDTNTGTNTVKLRDVAIGSVLRVIGYEPTARDYKRKLLAMGLTPGTELRVTRHAPLGDPTEIEVRDFHLSLRKDEADALIVSPVPGEAS